jgi:hypothetical protein
MSGLFKVPTKELLYELFDRVDDNLFAPGGERQYDPFLDAIDIGEKKNLYQILRLTYEDYKDFEDV